MKVMIKNVFKTIQNTFSNIFETILNNKYLKALFLTPILMMFVGLFVLITILAFQNVIIGVILLFAIIYFVILSDLN